MLPFFLLPELTKQGVGPVCCQSGSTHTLCPFMVNTKPQEHRTPLNIQPTLHSGRGDSAFYWFESANASEHKGFLNLSFTYG